MKNSDLPAVYRALKKHYESHRAPVVELEASLSHDPFRILVTTILSARTKDQTTAEVSRRLFKKVKTYKDLNKITLKQMEKLIHPIGFFRTKAKHLKQLPAVLEKEFGGKVPASIDEMCKLPGVGRKTANLVMTVAFDKNAICVDVHVHRICNRMGYLKTSSPYDTEMKLREILPKRYWKTWNSHLVSYGQMLCFPVRPSCSTCTIRKYCKRIGVTASR
jgi:endonuclease III